MPTELADRIQRAHPDWAVSSFPLRLPPGQSLELDIISHDPDRKLGFDQVFVDPHNGRIIGHRSKRPGWDRRHLIEGIYALHVRLVAGEFGRWLMGIVAMLWLISSMTGVYLTIPQVRPFLQRWKRTWLPALRGSLPKLSLDWHRATGLWMLIGFLVLAVTAIELTFYYALMVPIADTLFPAPETTAIVDSSKNAGTTPFEDALAKARAQAAQDLPNWEPAIASHDPQVGTYAIGFIPKNYPTYSHLGPITYVYGDGRLIDRDDPYANGARGYIMRSMYPLHTGEVAGWPTELVVFLLGFGACGMTLSGLYLWWRKTFRRRGPRISGKTLSRTLP